MISRDDLLAPGDDEARLSLQDAARTLDLAQDLVLAAVVGGACDIKSNPALMAEAIVRSVASAITLLCGPGEGVRLLAACLAMYQEQARITRAGKVVDPANPLASVRRLHRLMDHLSDQLEASPYLDRQEKWTGSLVAPDWLRLLARVQSGLAPEGTGVLTITCALLPDGQPDIDSIKLAESQALDRTGNLMLAAAAHQSMSERYLDLALAETGGTA